MIRSVRQPEPRSRRGVHRPQRRGVVLVLSALSMVMIVGFVAFSVDVGMISLTKVRLQTAADAAALAASQVIAQAVAEAGATQGSGSSAVAAAEAAAREKAVEVAAANGVYVDPQRDVKFGNRTYNVSTGKWETAWGSTPYNAVQVTAHRDQPDTTAPDGKLKLSFAWILGHPTQDLTISASAYVEARDIVAVLDYSASMNDDSTFAAFSALGQANVEANMVDIYNQIGAPAVNWSDTGSWFVQSGQPASGTIPHIDVTWRSSDVQVTSTLALSKVILRFDNGNEQRFSGLSGNTGTFAGSGSNSGRRIDKVWVKSGTNSTSSPGSSFPASDYGELFQDTTSNIKSYFGLNAISWPYASGSWDDFISYMKTDSSVKNAGYRKKYGKVSFVQYLNTQKPAFSQTNVLWKGPSYPAHALKLGASQMCSFLDDLNFNDRLGLVIYSTESRIETQLSGMPDGATVDLGSDWLTYDMNAIDTIQSHKQAGHYSSMTAIGLGLKDAKTLLDAKSRVGARKVVILMTDGLANVYPSGWSLPSGFNWPSVTDLDGDGDSDYSTSNKAIQYTFYEAEKLIADGVVIHTLCVGSGADTLPMQCIAAASGGKCIIVPGGTSIAQMQADLEAAFSEIAGKVPPPELTQDE